MKAKGIAYACTEPNLTLKVITTKLFERDGVSQTHFISAHNIAAVNSEYYSWMTSNNITWTPDYGTWPKPAVNVINTIVNGVTGVHYSFQNRKFNCLGKQISEASDITPGLYIYKSNRNAWGTMQCNKSRFLYLNH
jgi:hypothetical protein